NNSWTIPFFSLQSYQAFGLLYNGYGLVLHRCSSADTEGYITGMVPSTVFNNQWHFVAVSVNYPNYYWQFDGNGLQDSNSNNYYSDGLLSIGAQYQQCDGNQFDGDIADVQIYNTSLSTSDIQTLYQEGIGGVPIDLNYLVAWYPLNGNANDYSGNNNNGQINNVIFTTSWQNGYTSP
ncbi:MAG: LamG-like jellyroll fold domain-containing protein, partial [Candidatus Micrarchaeia archaeon]